MLYIYIMLYQGILGKPLLLVRLVRNNAMQLLVKSVMVIICIQQRSPQFTTNNPHVKKSHLPELVVIFYVYLSLHRTISTGDVHYSNGRLVVMLLAMSSVH